VIRQLAENLAAINPPLADCSMDWKVFVDSLKIFGRPTFCGLTLPNFKERGPPKGGERKVPTARGHSGL